MQIEVLQYDQQCCTNLKKKSLKGSPSRAWIRDFISPELTDVSIENPLKHKGVVSEETAAWAIRLLMLY